ncbi:MAG: hypothetical protein KDK36_21480 [Leptospiraceae bacterium]|nr:hypothetical protein [Leptospiraceae bacterium]
MKPEETRALNRVIRDIQPDKNKKYDIHVDSLHLPFIILEEKYLLPSIPLLEIDFNSAKIFLQEIAPHFSSHLKEFFIIPETRPKKDSCKLMLAKEIEINSSRFIYIIKFETVYLGGADKENKITEGTQNLSPSIKTNRIYFTSRILPVSQIIKSKGEIIDFEIPKYEPSIYSKETEGHKKKFFSELFDEIDYSEVMNEIKSSLEIEKHWKLGRVFDPIFIEHLSMSVRFLNFDIEENINEFKKFYKLVTNVVERNDFSDIETILNFHKWLEKFSFERTKTLSGNIAWKILVSNPNP